MDKLFESFDKDMKEFSALGIDNAVPNSDEARVIISHKAYMELKRKAEAFDKLDKKEHRREKDGD